MQHDFVINRFFMKLFNANSVEMTCQNLSILTYFSYVVSNQESARKDLIGTKFMTNGMP